MYQKYRQVLQNMVYLEYQVEGRLNLILILRNQKKNK